MVKGKTWQIIPRPLLERVLHNLTPHHCVPQPLILHGPQADRKGLFFSHSPSRFSSTISTLVPSHKQIGELILEAKSASQALETFEWASKISNFTHSLLTYRALIHKLCTFHQFNIVSQLLDEIPKTTGSSLDDDIFITVVRGYGRARMTREAIRVLDLVPKLGKGTPSLKLLNSILDFLVKEDIDIAREFYRKKMMGNGVKGDDYTYAILMKGFCLTNRIHDGVKLLQVMKNHNVNINVVVYNTLIYALCKNGKVGRARSLMNEMGEFSDVTFNILISAYCDDNNFIQALVMMDKCFNKGFMPDVVTLTKVVEILCNAGRIKEALEVLERAEEKGGVLDVVAYNTMLKGFVKAGKVGAASGFLKQMEMKGCLPNTETYNILIAGFCECRMVSSANDLFHEMKRVGVPWNFVTFETLIHGFCSSGRTRDGFKMFELMVEGKGVCGINIAPYNSILYGLYRGNCLDQALEFLNYMRNLFPRAVDRSWRILQLCEEGGIQEAKQILDKMHEEGSFPSALVYANLIQGFCKDGFMKDAVELMNEMIGHGYLPVASTINALIGQFCQKGKVGAVLRLVEDLTRRDCLLDLESYMAIFNAMCSQGELPDLVLLVQMVERGITPNYCIWNVVIHSTLKGTSMSHEHELLQELTEA